MKALTQTNHESAAFEVEVSKIFRKEEERNNPDELQVEVENRFDIDNSKSVAFIQKGEIQISMTNDQKTSISYLQLLSRTQTDCNKESYLFFLSQSKKLKLEQELSCTYFRRHT